MKELTIPGATEVTPTGVRFSSSLSSAQWRQAGALLARVINGTAWMLGDWLNFGLEAYGERYAYASKLRNLEISSLRDIAWVCERFEAGRRRESLSFTHHREVAALARGQQEKLLDRAEKEGWSVSELRRNIREGEASKDETVLPRTFLPATWVQDGLRYFRAQEVDKWPAARRQALKEELRPFVEQVYNRL